MADKQITVAVPEERVAEFYVWFGEFLAAEPGSRQHRGRRGPRGPRRHTRARAVVRRRRQAGDLAVPQAGAAGARAVRPAHGGVRRAVRAASEIARRLGLDKGAHGVAGILAWPGRYSRHLAALLPIETAGRPDGGTDYYMEPEVAALFRKARGLVSLHSG